MMSMPSLAVAIPFIAALLTAATGKLPLHRNITGLICGGAMLIVTWIMFSSGLKSIWLTSSEFKIAEGLSLKFAAEPAGIIFLTIIAILWPLTTLYAIGYMNANGEKSQTRFFFFLHMAVGFAAAIALSANLATTFFFYEGLSLATLPLVCHSGSAEARKAGRIYLFTLVGSSLLLLLPAIIITWHTTGRLDYSAGGLFSNHADAPWLGILLAMYILGTAKSALMPLHRWLPSAMVAPVPVSALLHAVAVVKSGVFIIIKLVIYIFGLNVTAAISGWLIAAAGITIIAAGLIATRHDDLKLRLAYSTISQLSYITMAAASSCLIGVRGALLHMIAHAFGKITLFFTTGSIQTATGIKNMSGLNGTARAMPYTIAALCVAALCIVGAPLTIGGASKSLLLATENSSVTILIIIGAILSIAYLLPIPWQSFKKGEVTATKLPVTMAIAQMATAIACIALLLMMPQINALLDKLPL